MKLDPITLDCCSAQVVRAARSAVENLQFRVQIPRIECLGRRLQPEEPGAVCLVPPRPCLE